jgi:hypothetical protein
LIQVPAIRAHPSRRTVKRQASARRRLRKEVRWAGSAALLVATTAFGVAGLTTGFQSRSHARTSKPAESVDDDAPVISLSLEPITSAAVTETAAPVVRPAGYILPDDGTEEGTHAGS